MTSADVHDRKRSESDGVDTEASTQLLIPAALLITVEQVAVLWFGEVGPNGSASANCQRIRRLIPRVLPARRIGHRWYVNRLIAEQWAAGCDDRSEMAHPATRAAGGA